MSQENVEIVHRAFETLARDGGEAVLAFLDPEVEWDVRSDLPDSDIYRGHEGMRRLFATFDEVLEESWYSPQEFIDAGDRVIVVLRWGGRGKGSGVVVGERDEAWIFTVHGGKVIRVKEYPSRSEALEAAGLSE
jgi:ketosteroid isomerase-like protein